MLIYLLRFCFFSWILLNSSCHCQDPTIEFKIFDGLGQPTTYLYENGRIEVHCTAPASESSGEVSLNVYLVDGSTVVLLSNNGSLSYNVSLDQYNYKKMFCFSGSTKTSKKLEITYRMCNPLLMTPPKVGCSEQEVCVRKDAATAACQKISSLECDMDKYNVEKNLPALKFICTGDEKPMKKEHQNGLCTASKETPHVFSGTANQMLSCVFYKFLQLDKQNFLEGSVYFKSLSENVLNIEFISITAVFEKAECVITFSTGSNLTPIRANGTNVMKQILTMKYTLSDKQILENLPRKGILVCAVNTIDGQIKSTSVQLVLYDERLFRMNVLKLSVKNKPGVFSLICDIEPIDGIYFTVSWDEEPDKYMNQTTATKTISDRFEDIKKKFICFASGYAYQHPVKGELLKLPKSSIQKIIEIERGTEQTGDGKGPDGRSGNSTKDSLQNQENNSNKTNSVDLATVVGVVMGLLLLFVIIAVVVFFAVKIVRKRSKHAFLRICRKDKKHLVQSSELEDILKNVRTAFSIANHKNVSISEVLHTNKCINTYKEEFENLKAIKPLPAELGYLKTARFPKDPIIRKTNMNNSKCQLENAKPTENTLQSKSIQGLHMNMISDCQFKDRFVACSAPTPEEFPLFFETLFEKKIPVIICFTKDAETKNKKVGEIDVYWSLEEKVYGGYTVTTNLLDADRGVFEIRELILKKKSTGETFSIQHILFLDVKVMSSKPQIFDFGAALNYMKRCSPKETSSEENLVLVHCLDGTGMTSIFITTALGIQFLELYGLPINFYQIVKKLRSERASAMTSLVEYIYAMWCVATWRHATLTGTGIDFNTKKRLLHIPTNEVGVKSVIHTEAPKKQASKRVKVTSRIDRVPISLRKLPLDSIAPNRGSVASRLSKSKTPNTE